MIERAIHPSGLVTYISPLLRQVSVPHAFSTRLGGVSAAPHDTLTFQPASRTLSHLGGPAEVTYDGAPPDEHERVAENFRRFARAAGGEGRRIACVWQVHGCEVAAWPGEAHPQVRSDALAVVAKADGLVTADAGVMLCVRAADCMPILLADQSGRTVAAIHAGWRGVVGGAAIAALDRMRNEFNVDPSKVIAAIGPCISVEQFEVGPEVAEAFVDAKLDEAIDQSFKPRPHIDLPGAIALQLQRAGVPSARIDRTDRCTFRDEKEFFSHRRDAGKTGRNAAIIGVTIQPFSGAAESARPA